MERIKNVSCVAMFLFRFIFKEVFYFFLVAVSVGYYQQVILLCISKISRHKDAGLNISSEAPGIASLRYHYCHVEYLTGNFIYHSICLIYSMAL
jgi:hypothetical protein